MCMHAECLDARCCKHLYTQTYTHTHTPLHPRTHTPTRRHSHTNTHTKHATHIARHARTHGDMHAHRDPCTEHITHTWHSHKQTKKLSRSRVGCRTAKGAESDLLKIPKINPPLKLYKASKLFAGSMTWLARCGFPRGQGSKG